MREWLDNFLKSDTGEAIVHCFVGAVAGLFGWLPLFAVWAWFFGREMGQHDDGIREIHTKYQLLVEAHGPLAAGLTVMLIKAMF